MQAQAAEYSGYAGPFRCKPISASVCPCFNSDAMQRREQRRNCPKGEHRTAQAFRPGKDTHKELALKLKGRPNRDWSQRRDTLLFAFRVRGCFHKLCTRISLVRPSHSAVPSGRFCLGRLPRPEGLGCSLFSPFGRSGLRRARASAVPR
jgi:hypothetical protein